MNEEIKNFFYYIKVAHIYIIGFLATVLYQEGAINNLVDIIMIILIFIETIRLAIECINYIYNKEDKKYQYISTNFVVLVIIFNFFSPIRTTTFTEIVFVAIAFAIDSYIGMKTLIKK